MALLRQLGQVLVQAWTEPSLVAKSAPNADSVQAWTRTGWAGAGSWPLPGEENERPPAWLTRRVTRRPASSAIFSGSLSSLSSPRRSLSIEKHFGKRFFVLSAAGQSEAVFLCQLPTGC